jgi:hypothetical protein
VASIMMMISGIRVRDALAPRAAPPSTRGRGQSRAYAARATVGVATVTVQVIARAGSTTFNPAPGLSRRDLSQVDGFKFPSWAYERGPARIARRARGP